VAVNAECIARDDDVGTTTSTKLSAHQPYGPDKTSASGNDLDDSEVLERAKAAANGEKFRRLWRGSTAGYPSQSEADMALCALLAFWTGGDATQMDRLFRESGLLRPKWDEQHFADGATYGERTIERAIVGTDEYYSTESADEWQPVPKRTQREASVSRSDSPQTGGETAPTSTVDTTENLDQLREQLAELEAENERLRAELAAERRRTDDRAVEETSGQEEGFFSRLL